MELGRSMMSAGAGPARAAGSSTTDRKICDARRFQRAVRPSCAEQTDRLEPAVRLWSTSPFLFSGLLLAVWFGATMELGRSMMSAGAGAARATGSSTTDRKTALTAIAIHIEDAGRASCRVKGG